MFGIKSSIAPNVAVSKNPKDSEHKRDDKVRKVLLKASLALGIFFTVGAIVLAGLVWLFQGKLIYHPRPYSFSIESSLPQNVFPIEYETSQGSQTSFLYHTGKIEDINRLYICFNGNASLALDWLWILEDVDDPSVGFVLVDYPSYGECEGVPFPSTIHESAMGAVEALKKRFPAIEEDVYTSLNLLGFSLGAAIALDFAETNSVGQIILMAPFSSTHEMAKRTIVWPFYHLLRHPYDNEAAINKLTERDKPFELYIFHGKADQVIPFEMGRELSTISPDRTTLRLYDGIGHGSLPDVIKPALIKLFRGEKLDH